jgi:hypothetical protein
MEDCASRKAHQFVMSIPKQLADSRVGLDDHTIKIGDDHGLTSHLEDAAVLRLHLPDLLPGSMVARTRAVGVGRDGLNRPLGPRHFPLDRAA